MHELGHFLTVMWFGVTVIEFGFGSPPRLFGVRRGETIYSVNWVLLGGFVRIPGEDSAADPQDSDPDRGGRHTYPSPLWRASVLVAGSA